MDKEFKNINISLYGKLEEVKERPTSTSLKITSDSGMIVGCFYNGKEHADLNEMVGKNVCCMGTASRKPFSNREETEILGYETTYNIFRVVIPAAKKKHVHYSPKK